MKWQLVNPEGVDEVDEVKGSPNLATLGGKTVLLRWNGKHNGDVLLNAIGDLLVKNIEDMRVIRNWEVAPETAMVNSNPRVSKESAIKLAGFRPDISIASQAD